MGVVGGFTSTNAIAAGEVFGNGKLVLISPSSTASRTTPGSHFSDFVFRTAPTDEFAGKDLADFLKQQTDSQRVLIIYNEKLPYSKSLKIIFSAQFTQGRNSLEAYDCDLSRFSSEECIKQASIVKADTLMISLGTEDAIEKAVDIIDNGSFRLIGGDALYNGKLLSQYKRTANGMILAVPWYRDLAKDDFIDGTKQLWGTSNVSWRVATSYDAMSALAKAITNAGDNPTREGVYNELKRDDFSAIGATGEVKFCPSHDRKLFTGLGVLVKVTQEKESNKRKFNQSGSPPERSSKQECF